MDFRLILNFAKENDPLVTVGRMYCSIWGKVHEVDGLDVVVYDILRDRYDCFSPDEITSVSFSE